MSPGLHEAMPEALHEALNDLAGQAPNKDLSARVIAGARRRRRVKLAAVPAVAVGVAGVVLAGGSFLGGVIDGDDAPNATAPVAPGGVLNAGPLPGPLPKRKVEPIQFAYVDRCQTQGGPKLKPVKGDCAQWRVVGRSGRQWRVADGLGAYAEKTDTYMNSDAPLEISPDGRRIAYYRPKDERFVVRDLPSGKVTVVNRRTPVTDLYRSSFLLDFSNDGDHLLISGWEDTPDVEQAMLADVKTGAVTALPSGHVVGLGKDASTVAISRSKGKRTDLILAGPDGRVRQTVRVDAKADLDTMSGNQLSPDGHTLVAGRASEDKEGFQTSTDLLLVDARTGKIAKVLKGPDLEGPGEISGWMGPSQVFLGDSVPDAIPGRPGYQEGIMSFHGKTFDLTTGKSKTVTRAFGIRANQVSTAFSAYLP